MFKRSTKLTALLVAAASVMSLVPAMAADAKRLGTKDGVINDAVAFNGKYIYEGYKGDTDKAVYFNDGSKDKELTDFTDYDFTTGTYADKYALAEDNGDDYLVDLTNGNVLDETLQDKKDSTASKLEKALKKTDKYDGATVVDTDLTALKSSTSFAAPFYSFTSSTGNTILTDAEGKYVDATVLANIYAYSTAKGKIVKVDKFATDYSETGLRVDIKKQPKVIAQDKDNYYAVVNVDITDTASSNLSVKAGTKATAEIDFSKAVIGDTSITTGASKEAAAIDTTKFTSGASIVVNGKAYTQTGSYTNANLLTDLLNTSITGYNKSTVNSGNTVVFTAATNGNKTNVASNTSGSAVTVTDGSAGTTSTTSAAITIAGQPFTYDKDATGSDAYKYSSLTDLKNKISNEFTGTTITGAGSQTYSYLPATYSFVSNTTGSAYSVSAVSGDLDDVKNIVAGTDNGASETGKVTNAWYLQKISKAQGDTDEDAFEPKSVTSYQIDNKSLYDDGDANDAYGWLIQDGSLDFNAITNVQVKDGALYVYKATGSNVKTYKLNLKQVKKDPINSTFGTTKLDGYVVEKDGDSDQDYDAFDVDSNGVVWALHDGKIVKFDGKDKTTVYTVDSGFNAISVYDEKNLIAWNEDDERYTTVSEGTEVTQKESTVVAPVIKTNWDKNADGTWSFYDATGAKVVSKWINVGGAWYYLKADGIMATGWYNDNGTWYYLNASGAMATGWINDGGTWYYLAGSGAMLANTTVDGYKLGASGAWVK